jgi:hypothetical protein
MDLSSDRLLMMQLYIYVYILQHIKKELQFKSGLSYNGIADASGGEVYEDDLPSIFCLYWGFESRRMHGCLSLVCAVCCQAEVSAMGRFVRTQKVLKKIFPVLVERTENRTNQCPTTTCRTGCIVVIHKG